MKEEIKVPEAESKEGKPKEKTIKNIEKEMEDNAPETMKKQIEVKEKINQVEPRPVSPTQTSIKK
ncbi:hypothetical protein D3C72_2408980 [compost metagenome]